MSDIEQVEEINIVDLTMYGCPMHYLKTKDMLRDTSHDQPIYIEVNNGKAVKEVLDSLRQDLFICSVENQGQLTTTIKVTKTE
jgi:TusA-related sulfurtransferase